MDNIWSSCTRVPFKLLEQELLKFHPLTPYIPGNLMQKSKLWNTKILEE